jgi:hypothetical protein
VDTARFISFRGRYAAADKLVLHLLFILPYDILSFGTRRADLCGGAFLLLNYTMFSRHEKPRGKKVKDKTKEKPTAAPRCRRIIRTKSF